MILTADKCKYKFELGFGEFFAVRKAIADLFDKEISSLYHRFWCDQKAVDDMINVLDSGRFKEDDEEIIRFLLYPNGPCKFDYKTCGKLYKLVRKEWKEKIKEGIDYSQLRKFFRWCYFWRKDMRWS